jgi:hypothetical protein
VRLKPRPWLVDPAARDDPPSAISEELLAGFHGAGVGKLVPAAGSEALPAEEAARATGIGALGPGFGFGESFEDEPAPLAVALVRLRDHVELQPAAPAPLRARCKMSASRTGGGRAAR